MSVDWKTTWPQLAMGLWIGSLAGSIGLSIAGGTTKAGLLGMLLGGVIGVGTARIYTKEGKDPEHRVRRRMFSGHRPTPLPRPSVPPPGQRPPAPPRPPLLQGSTSTISSSCTLDLSAEYFRAGVPIGFEDKNGMQLCLGQTVRTYDSRGKEWLGTIIAVALDRIGSSPITNSGGLQCAFRSNYETWINNQEYASQLEIIAKVIKKRNKIRFIRI